MSTATFGRIKTWGDETLEPADLNAEFDNIINNVISAAFWKAGNIDLSETFAWTGTHTHTGTITVGVDGTGHDVKFFGDTSGKFFLWDQSADRVEISGDLDMLAIDNRIDFDADNDTSIRASADDIITLEAGAADRMSMSSAALYPATDDGMALGIADTNDWSDLFMATGAVINFENGDVTVTHSANTLTVAGGTLATAALTATTITGSGVLSIDDTTDSTSGTTGSIHTDGGLGVAKDLWCAATVNAAGDTAAGDNAAMGYTATEGLILTGQGSTSDVTIKNDADATVISIPTGGTTVNFAGSIDLVTTGNRIDLDTDNDTSIRCSGDDVMEFEAGGVDAMELRAGASRQTTLALDAPTDESIELSFNENGAFRYVFGYSSASDYFRVQSTDINGSGGNGDVIRILDGQTSIDGNGTFDDNAFDYVCDGCGRHEAEVFECCGEVAWHDDVALMKDVVQNLQRDPQVIRKMEKLGIVNTYGTLGTDNQELFTSMNKMPWFLMSGMVQQQARIDSLETEVAKLRSAA